MVIAGESSTSVKLLAKGVFGRGPRQPAKEKEAPLGEVISVGPGRVSDIVVVVNPVTGSEVDMSIVLETGGELVGELSPPLIPLLLISGVVVEEKLRVELDIGGGG